MYHIRPLVALQPSYYLAGRTHISMVLPNTANRVKLYLKPPETIQEPRQFKLGDLVWVRDFRPNARQKWAQGTVLVPVGTLQYNVSIEDMLNTRRYMLINYLNEYHKQQRV